MINVNLTGPMVLAGIGVAVVGIWYVNKKAADVASAIDPTNNANVFYQGTNRIGEAITGSEPGGWSLGSQIYDWIN